METGEFSPVVRPFFFIADRAALSIEPKNIYYQWFKGSLLKKEITSLIEPEIFLIPSFGSYGHAEAFIRNFFDLFFQFELRKQTCDSRYWPQNRSYELFLAWFDIRITCTVTDILSHQISRKL